MLVGYVGVKANVIRNTVGFVLAALISVAIGISLLINSEPGMAMGTNFNPFARDMVLILPPAFVLIGPFDVSAKPPMPGVPVALGHLR